MDIVVLNDKETFTDTKGAFVVLNASLEDDSVLDYTTYDEEILITTLIDFYLKNRG